MDAKIPLGDLLGEIAIEGAVATEVPMELTDVLYMDRWLPPNCQLHLVAIAKSRTFRKDSVFCLVNFSRI